VACQNTSNISQNNPTNYHNQFHSNNDSGLDCDSPNKYRRYSSHEINFHNAPRGRSNDRGYYSHNVNHHHSPAGRCDGRGRHAYHEGGCPYNHETLFGMQGPMEHENFMARTQVLNNLISFAERTLNTSGAYQSFGPGGNGGRFQHHDRGGNRGRFHHHGRGDNAGCHHISDNQ
jgi:hypothetical protein